MQIDFVAVLGKSLALLTILAAQTATKVDDELVEFLQAIYDSPKLLDWFKGKFQADAEGVLALESEAPEALALEIRERKIDWAKLIEKLPAIIAIVKTFAAFAK